MGRFEIGLMIVILVAGILIGTWAWDYTLDYWFIRFGRGDFPWQGALILAVIPGVGQLSLPAAACTYVISQFVDREDDKDALDQF